MKTQIKNFLPALAIACASQTQAAILWTESFETDGQTTRYTASLPFRDSTNDYWERTDGTDISVGAGNYSLYDGDFFWAAEDVDDDGGNGEVEQTILFPAIQIADHTDLRFTGMFGAGNGESFDSADYVVVEYSLDGAGYVTGLSFHSADPEDGTNVALGHDTTGDGIGDGNILAAGMQEFTFPIPDGEAVEFRIRVHMNSANEEIAMDRFQLEDGIPSPVPEPRKSAAVAAGILLGFAGLRKRQGRSGRLTDVTVGEPHSQ